MELSDPERDLLLAGLFELTITYAENDELRQRTRALAWKIGGDPYAMFFDARRHRPGDPAGRR